MPPQKAQKIDFNTEYPCPCRRRGRLLPITLTEALGCDRCQHIFVVEKNGQTIEELSTSYPYKRAWRWTGNRWITARRGAGYGYIRLVMGIFTVLSLVCLLLAWQTHSSLMFITVLGIVILLMLVMIFWLAYRP